MTTEAIVHGVEWTVKELFVYPNEFIYWSIQIVMYPYMTGLVAGAFVLSSLYHVFGQKDLKEIAQFSLVFSLALLPVAALPLLLHLQQPLRAMEPLLTPHFTSAIAAFGIVFTAYGLIVVSEIWFVYRKYFVEQVYALKGKPGLVNFFRLNVYRALTMGSFDISEEAQRIDKKAAKILAAVGIPVACFLHGYAGFIFGSVKANALWMSPLMPVIFIMSAVVSGIALCMLTYIGIMEWQAFWRRRRGGAIEASAIKGAESDIIDKSAKYLIGHGDEVLGHSPLRHVRERLHQHFRTPVHARQSCAVRPVDPSRADYEAHRTRSAARVVRCIYDALERRHRRAGVFAVVLGIHALSHPDHSAQHGDV
jgi:formate-dependent nitrite reductase membrane component NrfD